mmetsp:Transcript_64065/g.202671  ORF Transcript_64065/g.202671 Transcript_64065/m.202671 type:complete len:488 (+) Transcript_64065:243-1706(+)
MRSRGGRHRPEPLAEEELLLPHVGHIRNVRPVEDVEDRDLAGVFELREQLGGEEEALRSVALASALDKLLEDLALVDRIHALVDLVHHAEGAHGDVLEGDEVENSRHGPLPARLAVRCQLLQPLLVAEADEEPDCVVLVLLTRLLQLHLPAAADRLEVALEVLIHLGDQLLELGQPFVPLGVDLPPPRLQLRLLLPQLPLERLQLLRALLVLLNGVLVGANHQPRIPLAIRDEVDELCLLAGEFMELFPKLGVDLVIPPLPVKGLERKLEKLRELGLVPLDNLPQLVESLHRLIHLAHALRIFQLQAVDLIFRLRNRHLKSHLDREGPRDLVQHIHELQCELVAFGVEFLYQLLQFRRGRKRVWLALLPLEHLRRDFDLPPRVAGLSRGLVALFQQAVPLTIELPNLREEELHLLFGLCERARLLRPPRLGRRDLAQEAGLLVIGVVGGVPEEAARARLDHPSGHVGGIAGLVAGVLADRRPHHVVL